MLSVSNVNLKPLINRRRSFILFSLLFIFSLNNIVVAQEENLNVLENWIEWSDKENMLIHHLNKQAFGYLDLRDREISKLETKADWLNRQREVKDIFIKIVGPFPEKTPLNPKITGTIQKNGFRVEKIIYESMPGYYVSSNLFIPNGIKGKRPAIIYVCGHSGPGIKDRYYQIVILNLVRKGFIVFAIDPIGQGERLQYYDPEKKKSIIGGPVQEHSYVGNQCFLSGVSLARYFIWDGIRGVDYLLTRREVDPERIGLTGRSGGGTQTAYIAAFDERIAASAPECYITSHRRLLETIGAQDAEQNFYHWLINGAAIEDLLEVRAPKPTLMVTTTRDMFSIQGAREVFEEAMKAYKAFGKEENLEMVEDDAPHQLTQKNREAVYAFFQKYLDFPGNPKDEDVEPLKPEELKVTPTGQFASSLGGETTFSLNKKETQELIEQIEVERKNNETHLNSVKSKAKELSGYTAPFTKSKPVYRGTYQREGYSIGMYALRGEGDYVIPLLLFVPDGDKKFPAVIYIHPEGKAADAAIGGRIEELVRKGFIVAAPDVSGIGEAKGKPRSNTGLSYTAILIGRSIVGIQAGDIVRVVDFLKTLKKVNGNVICATAFDELCPALLHAAVFEPLISRIALIGSPVSYRMITMNKFYEYDFSFSWGVAGSLKAYDLPDLAACVAPRKLLMIDLKDHMKQSASEELIDIEFAFPFHVYSQTNTRENLKILKTEPNLDIISAIAEWGK